MEIEAYESHRGDTCTARQLVTRNPAILGVLDPLHQSLLHNNLQYERVNSTKDEQQYTEKDSDEYFSSVSASVAERTKIEYTNFDIENGLVNNKCNESGWQQRMQRQEQSTQPRANQAIQTLANIKTETNFSCDDESSGCKIKTRWNKSEPMKHTKQSKSVYYYQSNPTDTENKRNIEHQMKNSDSTKHRRLIKTVRTMTKNNKAIDKNKHRRRCKIDGLHRNIPLESCNNGDSKWVSKLNATKQLGLIESSDCSDVNSDTNLLIENMKNRECEIFRKISFNNGYGGSTAGSSDSYTYSTSDISGAAECVCNAKITPTIIDSRKCKSFPLKKIELHDNSDVNSNHCKQLTKRNATESVLRAKNTAYRDFRNGCGCCNNSSNINTCEHSRRIIITIKTTAIAKVDGEYQNKIENSFTGGCKTDNETNTTDSDYVTVQDVNERNSPTSSLCGDKYKSDSDSNSFFSLKSDAENVSEPTEYFNCISHSDSGSKESHDFQNMNKVQSDVHQKKNKVQNQNKNLQYDIKNSKKTAPVSPMICIEQEMTKNRIITSRVEINRKKLKEFKRRNKKQSRPPKIIDESFCEEILNETMNLGAQSDISGDKRIIDNIVSSINVDQFEMTQQQSPQEPKFANENMNHRFINDGFGFNRLNASPKYTGKSIGRLLAHRLEQQTISNVRRTLLQNVAFAITAQTNSQKKEIGELPPIKPPRSFTASASSSPLSKQSFESSATVPIEEFNKITTQSAIPMGFVTPHQLTNNYRKNITIEPPNTNEAYTHFGWIKPECSADNESIPSPAQRASNQFTNSLHYYTAESKPSHDIGFLYIPKENIDMVDSSKETNRDFERFSAKLEENLHHNLSTPIKEKPLQVNDSTDNGYYETGNNVSFSRIPLPSEQFDSNTVTTCVKCNGKIQEKSTGYVSGKTGRRIGKAALKRAKTFIGTSKNFLKKPILKASKQHESDYDQHETHSIPLKDPDATACFNQDSICVQQCKKRMEKSLNLTPKDDNNKIVKVERSPNRIVERSKMKLLKMPPTPKTQIINKNDSDEYVTPDDSFDFDRFISSPREELKADKRSPSKMISKLAKSSKKLFRIQKLITKKIEKEDSTHYYRANKCDEVDNKVLLMGKMLSELRKKITNDYESFDSIEENKVVRPSSAKKRLFNVRSLSTSSDDVLDQESLSDQIAEIDLHNQPEPLYAEIEQTAKDSHRLNVSFSETVQDDVPISTESVKLQEVYINDQNYPQKTSKYIMVNNNPNILYATVKRNLRHLSNSSVDKLKNDPKKTECMSDDMMILENSKMSSSSCDSLNLSVSNEFVTTMQSELDKCQSKMNRKHTDKYGYDTVDGKDYHYQSKSPTDSQTASDLNSGCSSFYRKNKQIVESFQGMTSNDFIETLSFDSVGTESYCESVSRGNDLNSLIKDTIANLEYLPSETGDESSDSSNDFASHEMTYKSCKDNSNEVEESTEFISTEKLEFDSIKTSPNSSHYHTIDKKDTSSDSFQIKTNNNLSNFKLLKKKIRNSFRINSIRDKGTKYSDRTDVNKTVNGKNLKDTKSSVSSIDDRSMGNLQRKFVFESIVNQLDSDPNKVLNKTQLKDLIEKIRQQQAIQKQLEKVLSVCRNTDEFHNSRELVEAEELMLTSHLKEYSALEELLQLWQNDSRESLLNSQQIGIGGVTIKYLEFELRKDSIYNTHFNDFYLCVCSHRDQVQSTLAKERTGDRVVFNNLKMQFINLSPDFKLDMEIYTLRLRKNGQHEKPTVYIPSNCDASRFRLQGKAILTLSNLSTNQPSSYQSQRNLHRTTMGKYIYTTNGLTTTKIGFYGKLNSLSDSLKIGYHKQLTFDESKANGFLNIGDSNSKWDRLWCRIDGLSMNFWNYPQDSYDSNPPVLTINLEQCVHRNEMLIVNREVCSKPRAFSIDVFKGINDADVECNVQTYFIAAECQRDLELWLSEINRIFKIIQSWNL